MELMLGRDRDTERNVYLDASNSRAVLICGKRGSGKSYTLGVLLEELVSAGDTGVILSSLIPWGSFTRWSCATPARVQSCSSGVFLPVVFWVRLLIPGLPEELYDPDVLEAITGR